MLRRYKDRLGGIIEGANDAPMRLGRIGSRVYRSLKTRGERATKGRQIESCRFEAKVKRGVSLMMLLEGRHSMSVGSQVARGFETMDGVDTVEVNRTNHGAVVTIMLEE